MSLKRSLCSEKNGLDWLTLSIKLELVGLDEQRPRERRPLPVGENDGRTEHVEPVVAQIRKNDFTSIYRHFVPIAEAIGWVLRKVDNIVLQLEVHNFSYKAP